MSAQVTGPAARLEIVRQRAKENLELIGREGRVIYDKARAAGYPTLSAMLEATDPSDPQERAQGLDAFSRMLMVADIRTNSDRYGSYYASPVEVFAKRENVSIFAEWARRQWVAGTSVGRAQAGQRAVASTYLSSEFVAGSIQSPYDDDTTLRSMEIQPAIPLTEFVSRTRVNEGQDYRARYLTEPTAAQIRMLRIAEATEIPRTKLTEGTRAIRLLKFGRALEASYETLRRAPLDDLAFHIRRMAIQVEVDQVAAALDVAINGDGNVGTSAIVYNLTAMDPATTANNMTLTAWVNFRLQWPNPYAITSIFGRNDALLKVLMLNVPGTNTLVANADLGPLRQTFQPMNTRLADGVRYGVTADAPASRIVGVDNRFAIEHVVEAGSDISETERWITRQTEVLTFTFNEGFAVIDTNAVKVLNLAA